MAPNRLNEKAIETESEENMKIAEYENVKDLNYRKYCDYLQRKYGIGIANFMTRSWNKNPKASRTKEGLLQHHKFEDHAIMLSNKAHAKKNPYEWQMAKNIVYCDYLEHLFLHILICENPAKNKNKNEVVGIGGVINFLVPELNDLYSGWETKQQWRKKCHDLVADDKEVYLVLLKRFKQNCSDYPHYRKNCLYTSYNAIFGGWSRANNKKIFEEIRNL